MLVVHDYIWLKERVLVSMMQCPGSSSPSQLWPLWPGMDVGGYESVGLVEYIMSPILYRVCGNGH